MTSSSDLLKRMAGLSPEKRRLLELRLQMAKAEASAGVRPRARQGNTAPLSFAQQRLWLLDRLHPGRGAYNISYPLRIRGGLDVLALERALDALRERHEALRTTFAEAEGGPVQVIHPATPAPLAVTDLSHLPADEREAEARRRLNDDANAPFDLAAGPLLRQHLLRLAADEHLLLLTMHHVVSDGWSMGILGKELAALYAAFAEGRPSPLPPLEVQYADFAEWQREYLAGETLERHLAFWREHLAGAPAVLELPTDRPRPATESLRGATVEWSLPADLTERLRAVARDEGTTLFVVMLAALRVVLGRHAGQDDVVVGTPVANRTRGEVEGLMGFFVNTLALRCRVDGDPSFRELVRREKEATLGAFQNQDLPFERVVEELRIARDPGRNPLFQVMLTLQNAPLELPSLAGVTITPEQVRWASAKFDLTFDCYEDPEGGLAVGAEYATDLFEEATVRRILRHFQALLEDASADADRPRSALEMADASERHQVLHAWNDTAREYPRHASIPALFAEQAARTPDAVAVTFGAESLTYAELDARANRLARRLRALGAGEGSRVGISAARSAETVAAILAVLKAGGAYVPLDAAYPAARLRHMLAASEVSLLVVDGEVPEALADFAGPVVSLRGDAAAIAAESPDTPEPVGGGDSLAYVMFTSGSTGAPKGVAVRHHSVVRLVRNTNFADLGPEQVFLQIAPLAFDASTLELWGPLLNGGRLVVAPPGQLGLAELGRIVTGSGVTTLWLTTGLFHQMVDGEIESLRGLRQLLMGGDVASLAHARRAVERLPGVRLVHAYGPTEGTTFTTCGDVRPADLERPTLPIGGPIANTRVYVLDAGDRPCPVGVPGELCVAGDGLALGYVGDAAQTAERFATVALEGIGPERVYRTGDRARWLEDGTLEFLGRLDGQVKLRGFRIELGEIEAVLRAQPGVREAIVVVREDAPGDRRLVAYVVPTDGAEIDPAALRDGAGKQLPEYMLPAAIVALDAIPLTPNGKIDRRALPAPEWGGGHESAEPVTETEQRLAAIWREVLGAERVGADEDFFLVGGHSLLATQVVSRVRQAFGVELPLRALFEAPTVAALARRIDAEQGAGAADEAPPLVASPRDGGPVPLSFAQERLWFLDQLTPGSGVYNMPLVLDLRGELDAEALRRSVEHLVHRHEALRTTFAEVGGQPVQHLHPPAPFDVPVEDVEDEDTLARRVDKESWSAFDLERGPVVRARLLRVAPGHHVLVVAMHHVVSDGWSLGIVFRELAAVYGAFRRGESPDLPALALQYADYALWQRGWLKGEVLERQVEFWRKALAGAPALLELPTDRPRPAVQRFAGAAHGFTVPADLAARLRELGAAEGATLFMTLLAAFQALLGRLARQDEVVVGSPIAGRARAEVEPLVGFFVNTLALRADLAAAPTFRALLAQVRETTLGAYAHQDLPFERLVEELKVERSLAHAPVFQVMFALQNAPVGAPELEGLELSGRDVSHRISKFDLTLDVDDGEGELACWLEYATDLFDAATISRMGERFLALLRAAVGDPDRPLVEVDLLTEEERALLAAWSLPEGGPATEPATTLVAAFEAHADARPDAPALVRPGGTMSYGELDARAEALARRLLAAGVGPETRVGLCMERSPEMVVGILAILKAGGAHVPLDPGYPAERLRFMVEDSGTRVLVVRASAPEGLADFAGPAVAVDPVDSVVSADSSEAGAPRISAPVHPESLAYVIYTSGSTGKPKGIGIAHGSVVRLAREGRSVSVGAGDVVAQVSNASFDAALWEVWAALANGAALAVVDRETVLSPVALAEAYRAHGVTHSLFAVALFRQVVRAVPDAFAGMRAVMFGGEAADAAAVRRMMEAGAPERVLNVYGPTELTTYCTWHRVERVDDGAATVPIGRAVAHATAHVLDAALRPVPVGVAGELCVGGEGVARGYLGRPGLTADRFVPDPAGTGGRLYRTGDLVRWNARGELEFVGRADGQVKVRGFRVETGEVEAALAVRAGVGGVVVAVREDAPGDRRLVAYVVGREGHRPSPAALRDALKASMPPYMVPAAVVVLDAFPLTPNGKVDRAALPAPDLGGADEAFAAPVNPTEQVLSGIWRAVLGVGRVGREDDFFALGGHSLLATQVASRIRQTFRVELPLKAIFEAPRLRELAERVDATVRDAAGLAEAPLVAVPREGEVPLSFAQERLWFIERLQPGRPVYNMPLVLRATGALDVDALGRALGEVVRRHEPLRTTFARGKSGPVQVIAPAGEFHLPVTDISHLPEAEREAEAARIEDEHAKEPFDLGLGPLFRAVLLRLGPESHRLLLNLHHTVSDGWSMAVLFRELAGAYDAYRAGAEPALPEMPVQYADFAVWQRGWLAGETLERQVEYWRRKLAGVPPLELPTDRPRPPVPSGAGAHHEFRLSEKLAVDVERLAQGEGATPFMLMLAAFKALLHAWTGQDDVVVGSPIAGRNRAEVEPLIGFFVNALPLRTDLSGDPTFRELVHRVRETALEGYAHQDLPFERLVDELKVERSLARHPVFQVSFSVQNTPGTGITEPEGVVLEVAEGDTGTTKFDLTFGVTPLEDGLAGAVEYAVDLFDRATIERLGEHYREVLEAVAADPDLRLSELPRGMGEAERRRVLHDWNATEHPYDARPVHVQLADVAARIPDAPALEFGDQTVTYAEMDARADRLAARLAARGIGPESRVGLVVERSPELVVGLLGILKAGAAYVPLDPDYPEDRLRHMLADSGARLVVAARADALPPAISAAEVEVVTVDGDGDEADLPPISVDVHPDSLAYVIYTSGSTGLPKGVLVPHRGVPNLAHAQVRAFGMEPGMRVLQFASFSFDAAVSEAFVTLLAGGTLVLAPRAELAPGGPLLDTLRSLRIELVTLPPSVLALLRPDDLPDLRVVVSAGEAVTAAVVERWAPGRRFVNGYGPTEGTVGSTYSVCRQGAGKPTIGRPFDNVRAYVLDAGLHPVAPGVPGELYVGGAGVVRGYHGRPALTAERFVPDPFGGGAGARLYRTGDRARFRVDGEIEFLGRADEQVKIRGFRVEPGEVAALLVALPEVRDALVLAHTAERGGTRLVAYVVPAVGAAVDAEELRARLKESVPDYMVPAAVVAVDAFPLTPTGKVDRAALPRPDWSAAGSYVAPRGEMERAVAAVWEEVLGFRVGVEDNFFEVGGHSLLLAQLQEKVRERLGREVPMVDLFGYPTVASLAGHLDAQSRRDGPAATDVGRDRGALRRQLLQRRK